MNRLISFLTKEEVKFKTEKKLSECTSVGIGGIASLFVTPKSKEQFTKIIKFVLKNKIPHYVCGNMTNLLPSDFKINKVIISTLGVNSFTITDDELYADCGALFSKIILRARDMSLGGYEALFGIPGTVGGMLRINAGAYGSSISDLLVSVEVYDCRLGRAFWLEKEELSFFYRDSEIKKRALIVLGAKFRLLKRERADIIADIESIRKKRLKAQPISQKSLGSVFKKTDNLAASYLIDRCGLKGYSVGEVSVSEKHAGFFINNGKGTASDFLKLCDIVKEKVADKYGVALSEEFEYIE